VLEELRDGFRYVRAERTALATVALEGIAMLAYGALSVLAVVLAERRLGLDPRGYGALLAAFGGGSLLGSLAVGAVERRLGPRATLVAGFALVAAGTLPLAAVGAFLPALLGYACAGFGQMVVSVVGLTLFQRAVTDEVRGRAFSIYNTVSHGVLLLVTTGAATLADLVALGPTLALAGLSQLIGVAGALRWLPRPGDPHRRAGDGGTGRTDVP
jgi:predicted MFS family arabinose efflux permease